MNFLHLVNAVVVKKTRLEGSCFEDSHILTPVLSKEHHIRANPCKDVLSLLPALVVSQGQICIHRCCPPKQK